MSLQDQAMLANLTIHQWSARKLDRRATKEVDTTHGADGAGRYNKLLVDKSALDPITKAAGALRTLHYELTLAWGDNGDRLLPSSLFMDYTQKTRGAKDVFLAAVRQFVAEYPSIIQVTRKRLGSLYDPADYPAATQIASRFFVDIGFSPIAAADDFRVNVGVEAVAEIRAEIAKREAERIKASTEECRARVTEVVERYALRMSDEKGRVYDSMVDNARALITVLPALNVARDSELDRIGHEIEQRLLPYTISQLRSSASARQKVAEAANDILTRMKYA